MRRQEAHQTSDNAITPPFTQPKMGLTIKVSVYKYLTTTPSNQRILSNTKCARPIELIGRTRALPPFKIQSYIHLNKHSTDKRMYERNVDLATPARAHPSDASPCLPGAHKRMRPPERAHPSDASPGLQKTKTNDDTVQCGAQRPAPSHTHWRYNNGLWAHVKRPQRAKWRGKGRHYRKFMYIIVTDALIKSKHVKPKKSKWKKKKN